MPKFIIPTEDRFLHKVGFALLLLIAVLAVGTVFLSDGDMAESFLHTIELVTHIKAGGNPLAIVLSLVGYVTQFYILYIILEYVLEGKFRSIFTEVATLKNISKMKSHYIVCGGGRVGRHVADELARQKKSYVILEADELSFKQLKEAGYTVLNADALSEHALKKARIEQASWLVAGLGDDGDNILLVLAAKELSPGIHIAARANHERIVQKLKHAGADQVVLPEMLGGIKLAQGTLQVHEEGPPIDLRVND